MDYLCWYLIVLDWVSNNTNALNLGAVFLLVACDEFQFTSQDRNLGVKALFLSSLICHHAQLIPLHCYLLTLFSFPQPLSYTIGLQDKL